MAESEYPTPRPASAPQTFRRLRAEANFLRFPFFDLVRESSKSTRDTLEVRETEQDKNGVTAETLWKVYRGLESTFPGEFARRLHREVVERIISDLPRPVRNPIRLGSFSEICRLLDINTSGKNLQSIRSALLSIVTTNVRSTSTFYSKARKSYVDAAFHLYEMVVFNGDTLPDGNVADAVHVVLASWYLENLNANYVVPLDFKYYRQLKGSFASRMYELLHHWFFVAMRNNQRTIERRYSTLCAYFPLTRQSNLWKARQQLKDAHKQHHEADFLSSLPEWRPIPGTPDDWTLVYSAGPKARDEFRRNQNRRNQEAVSPDEGSPALLLPPSSDASALSDIHRDLVKELILRGVTETVATDLVQASEPALIQAKVEVFDWLVEKKDKAISQNPAGYLRVSIAENYAAPKSFLPRAEREQKRREKEALIKAEKDSETKEALEREERTTRLQKLLVSLPASEQDDLRQRALLKLNSFALGKLREEERDNRSGVGHIALNQEIYKLLEAKKPDGGGE